MKKRIKITSCIDASDGLYASLRILSCESKAALHIDCSKIAFRKKGKTVKKTLESALFDGEDFELVFTGSCQHALKIQAEFKKRFHIPLTIIGQVKKGKGIRFYDNMKKPVTFINKEFRHFGK